VRGATVSALIAVFACYFFVAPTVEIPKPITAHKEPVSALPVKLPKEQDGLARTEVEPAGITLLGEQEARQAQQRAMELYQAGRVAEAIEYDVALVGFMLKTMAEDGYMNGGESGTKYERGLQHVLDRMLHVQADHATGRVLKEKWKYMKLAREQAKSQGGASTAAPGDALQAKFATKTIALIANAGGPSQFPCVGYGGVEISVESLAWAMHRAGLIFFVVVPPRQHKNSYPFKVIEAGPADSTGGSGISAFIGAAKQVIRSEQAKGGVDAIWAQSHWSLQLAELGIQLVVTFHDSIEKQPGTSSSSPTASSFASCANFSSFKAG
jgi:hypothetical protein